MAEPPTAASLKEFNCQPIVKAAKKLLKWGEKKQREANYELYLKYRLKPRRGWTFLRFGARRRLESFSEFKTRVAKTDWLELSFAYPSYVGKQEIAHAKRLIAFASAPNPSNKIWLSSEDFAWIEDFYGSNGAEADEGKEGGSILQTEEKETPRVLLAD